MKIIPHGKYITGRIVDIDQSKGGLVLPTSDVRNVTVFLLVDDIGHDVQKVKPGEVILYMKMSHVWLRDGTHVGLVHEDDLIGHVTGLDPDCIKIEGDKKTVGARA